MPLVKGYQADGYTNINKDVRFLGALSLGSWGNSIFVDNDNGAEGNSGRSPSNAVKNLATAISNSSAGDVIYVRPRAPGTTTGGDPTSITPATGVNWVVPYALHGLSIIGCGTGHGKSGNYMTNLAGYSAITTPTLWVKAPFVNLENLNFRRGSSTVAAAKFSFSDAGPDYSFGNTIYNCTFWQIGSTAVNGALNLESSWHTSVLKSTFQKCYIGIYIGASNSVPVGLVIDECDFQGLAADVSADIFGYGAVTNILMKRLSMNHALPSAGAPNKFISFGAASTGEFMDSVIGATATAAATNTTLNGVGYSKIYCGTGVGLMAAA